MSAAYAVETLKLRRSRVVVVATVALLLVPAVLARGFLIAAESGGTDPMSAKASLLLPGGGWSGYLSGLIQIYATAGMIGSGIVVGWCFGRSTPTARSSRSTPPRPPAPALHEPSWCSSRRGPSRWASLRPRPPA